MKIYSLLLLSLMAGISITGCNSECCLDTPQDPIVQQPPVAKILLNGIEVSGTKECTPGETFTLTPASSDADGKVSENIWKVDGTEVANSTIVCPDDKKSTTICLSAMDNDGLYSKEQKCITFTGKAASVVPQAPSTTPPVATVTKGALTGDGIYFDCSNVHDTDNIHTYPNDTYLYGNNTPKDIKEVTWKYIYYKADGTIESAQNTKTQSEFNLLNNQAPGTCSKWFHLNGDVAKIDFSITTLDDDNETNKTNYSYDAATQTLTQN